MSQRCRKGKRRQVPNSRNQKLINVSEKQKKKNNNNKNSNNKRQHEIETEIMFKSDQ